MGNLGNYNLCKTVTYYVNPYYYWNNPSTTRLKVKNNANIDNQKKKEIIPLSHIIPSLLYEISSGSLQKFIGNIIISFMVATDMSLYISKQLSLNYIIEHLPIYEYQENDCRKKYKNVRAFIVNNMSFKGDKISIESPLKDIDAEKFENISHKLPERYKDRIGKYIKLRRYSKKSKIPYHIFWWKAIEDSFKEYFFSKFDCSREIYSYIKCNGISELRKHGILHNCFLAPPLYDTQNNDQKWYIEFFAVCTNVKPKDNQNSFPSYVIENKDKLIFEMKVVTYSNQKNLGLHMPTYD